MNRHGERDHQYDLLWSCEMDALTMISQEESDSELGSQTGTDERHHTDFECRVRIREFATSRLSVDVAPFPRVSCILIAPKYRDVALERVRYNKFH